MRVLICGSLAYDHIMVFPDRFRNHILPENINILNLSFTVPELRRNYGGCAGNIAYNLSFFNSELALPMATVGRDFTLYFTWLEKYAVDTSAIKTITDELTAQAFIMNDLDDNQITAFHPGAMMHAHENKIDSSLGEISLGILSPDGREGMLQHAVQFNELGIPFIFDPGQAASLFDENELIDFIQRADWMIVNDYEWELIHKQTGYDVKDVMNHVKALIITKGGGGSIIYTEAGEYQVPVVKTDKLSDPTGCGDAYRAGIIYGLLNELDWETSGRIASLLGMLNIQVLGTQNHVFDLDKFRSLYKEYFGSSF